MMALDPPQIGVRWLTFGGPRRAARRITPIALHLRTLDFRHIQQYAKTNPLFLFLIGKAIIFTKLS